MTTPVLIYDRHGKQLCRSENLRGLLRYYSKHPADLVIKVRECPAGYAVTFFFDDGVNSYTVWQDWRVLLDWLEARRSWSLARVTFHTPLYETLAKNQNNTIRIMEFRAKTHAMVTTHTYKD